MRSLLAAALFAVPCVAHAASADVPAIQNYVTLSSRLEAESQSMYGAMVHAMFGYMDSKSRADLQEFSADYDQDDQILKRLATIAPPLVSNAAAQSYMLKSVGDDRAWGANARTELHQLLQIGRTLTVSQYFAITKGEDARGTSLSNQSNAYTFAALKAEGLTFQQSEAVLLQAVAKAGGG